MGLVDGILWALGWPGKYLDNGKGNYGHEGCWVGVGGNASVPEEALESAKEGVDSAGYHGARGRDGLLPRFAMYQFQTAL